MTSRRKFLAGVGSLAAGSAAAVGTGAFSTQTNGTMKLDVVGPANAYLGVDGNTSSEYVSQSSPVTIDLAQDGNGGSGLSEMSDTIIQPAFTLSNGSSEPLYVEIDNPLANNDISTASGQAPAGVDVQLLTAPATPIGQYNAAGLGLIDRNDKVVDSGNGLGGGFDEPGSNEYYFHEGETPSDRTALVQSKSKSVAGGLKIGSGESYPVVFRAVVRSPGNTSLSADFRVEAYDDESQLTYDDLVNSTVGDGGATWPQPYTTVSQE